MTEWLNNIFESFLALAADPTIGLPAVFAWCAMSATLLPVGSEAVVFGYVKLHLDMFWWAMLTATLGNTLGGMLNYWLALRAHQTFKADSQTPRALIWFEKLGPKALFFSFLPVVGDPLTAVAGWLKMPWLPCLLWQMAGKAVRYVVGTSVLLWVPNEWWTAMFSPILNLF